MEDQRKAFEAWFMLMFPRESLVRYDIDEISGLSPYKAMPAFCAWHAWRAAIEHAKKTMCNRS